MSDKFGKKYLGRRNQMAFYISALVLLAIVATGLFMMSDNTASAQRGDVASRGDSNKAKAARADMLDFALRLGASADYTVFGAKGVRGNGASVSGKSGSGMDEASLGENGSGMKSRSDLNKAISMINQLPCQEMDAALTGGSFEPGVYCAPSAALAGQMTLNGDGRYVFLIEGAMKSSDNFQIDLQNGAKAGNVYFVADTASLGAWNSISGTVIARGSVDIGTSTKVDGRAMSKEGEVVLADGANLALAPGYIQICKFALHDGVARANAPAGTGGRWASDNGTSTQDLTFGAPRDNLAHRIFRFTINGGATISVPVGQCSNPILVNDATAVVTELNDGTYLPSAGLPANTTWTNRFRLVNISGRTTDGSATPALTTNLRTRSTSLSVPTAPSTSPVILDFTNTFAIPAVIEICKFSADANTTTTGTATIGPATSVPVVDGSVDGFFDFTVNTIQGRVFTIPVGFCSGPIFMDPLQNLAAPSRPAPESTTDPAPAGIYVTELGRPGFSLDSVSVFGGNGENRQAFQFVPNDGVRNDGTAANDPCAISTNPGGNLGSLPVSCFIGGAPGTNPGGGYVAGLVYENSTASDQTIFRFFNRTNPGIIKVCKIAGPGVPVGTRFVFDVLGRQASPGTILPGVDVARTVTVTAGPAAQGGNCTIVSEADGSNTRFIVGTLAWVREVDVLDDVPGVQSGGFGDEEAGNVNDGPTTNPASEVRVSRIRLNGAITGFPNPSGSVQGNSLDPNPHLLVGAAILRVNRGETVVEFVNILFVPTQLKLCKVAASPSLIGQPFTFNIEVDSVGGLVPVPAQAGNRPYAIAPVVIPAGDPAASSQGNCIIVDGPYERPGALSPPLAYGTFRVGSIVTVTEVGGSVVSITSPTNSPLVVNIPNRQGIITMINPGGFNELVFTNRDRPPGDPSLQPRVLTGTTDQACPGTDASVAVNLTAQGDEVSINFIVDFDETKLANPVVQIGSGALADGFVLNVNYANAGSGQLGISLTSPGNTPFTAGQRELIKIDFAVLGLVTGEALITFGGPTQTLVNTQNDVLPSEPGQASVTIGGALCTTSAAVTVSGRVVDEAGKGVRNATVRITDQQGNTRTVSTSSLGYYEFGDVESGETYVISANARRYRFNSRLVSVSDSLANLNFVGME